MMNRLWPLMILLALFCAGLTGRIELFNDAIFSGAQEAVTLSLNLLGGMALWSGLLEVASQGGLTHWVARRLRPLLRRFFPGVGGKGAAGHVHEYDGQFIWVGQCGDPLWIKSHGRTTAGRKNLPRSRGHSPGAGTVCGTQYGFAATYPLDGGCCCGSGLALRDPSYILPGVWVTSLLSLLTACAVLCMQQAAMRRKR